MPSYGSLDSLLLYRPARTLHHPTGSSTNGEQDSALEGLLEEKVRCLSDILQDIERDIKSRATLTSYVLYLISQHYCYLKSKLFELYTWQIGSNRSIENRRGRLEQQLDTLNQEKRQELVSTWQDIAALKKEFRTWFKQYTDLAQRVRLLLPGPKPLQLTFRSMQDDRKRIPANTRQLFRRA